MVELAHPAPSSPAEALPPSEPLDLQEAWLRVRDHLRGEIGADNFDAWCASLDLAGAAGDVVHLTAPTRFLLSWIERHYMQRIISAWRGEHPGIQRVQIKIRSMVRATRVSSPAVSKPVQSDDTKARDDMAAADSVLPTVVCNQRLDPNKTFETFVEGPCNALARGAALQIATGVAMFNPVSVHAPVGTGKTHLLQATAAAAIAVGRRPAYLSAERFLYAVVREVKSQSELLPDCDLLLLDDVHMLAGQAAQAAFARVLDSWLASGRTLALAINRSPVDVDHFGERARSRIMQGLVVEMLAPGPATRRGIVQSRIAAAHQWRQGFTLTDEVVGLIGHQTRNGRDIEGVINSLLAACAIAGQAPTLAATEKVLEQLVRVQERDPVRPKIEDIQRAVARHFFVSRADLLSSRRTANVVRPRQIAMCLAKRLTLRSLPEIGRRFGGRDHTTVLHAVRKIERLEQDDEALASELQRLTLEIAGN